MISPVIVPKSSRLWVEKSSIIEFFATLLFAAACVFLRFPVPCAMLLRRALEIHDRTYTLRESRVREKFTALTGKLGKREVK